MIVTAGLVHVASASAADRSLYAIGNSLTASILPFSVPGFASQQGDFLNVGFHTQSGAALDFIVANPSTANIMHPVTLDHALAEYAWSDISVQPYPSPTSTLASDIVAIQTVMNSARNGLSGSARLFIYSAWPSQTSFGTSGFAPWWRSAVPDDPGQPTVLNRSYADHLHARLVAAIGTSTGVYVIPVGDVMAAFDDLIRAGQVNGITDIRQLYADNDHTGDVGKFIAGLTVYTTLFRRNPSGLAIPFGYVQGNAAAQLTPELAAQLESLVWRVVNSDPRTGVNSVPVAAPQVLSMVDATTLPITLSASDAEGGNLTYTVVSVPAHGQLSGQPPAVTYVPDPAYQGSDSFSFKVSDGGLESAPATVSIAVMRTPVDTPESPGGGGGLEIWSLSMLGGMLGWAVRHRKVRATKLQ